MTIPDFKLYNRAMVTEKIWYLWGKKDTQTSGIEYQTRNMSMQE
jgi:hypothetical protein